MNNESDKLILPNEIERYIASLAKLYENKRQVFLRKLLVNSKIIIEEYSYDNWNGGQYGFVLRLRIPGTIFSKIIENKNESEKQICNDINSLIAIQREFINCVSIEMDIVPDENWRKKSGLLIAPHQDVASNALSRIWGSETGLLKIFLSHKVEHKKDAANLKTELERYGLSSFVAHEDIEPTKEWQDEIENALFSMDVLLALMTNNFNESDWTDQEVGVAIGRGVLIIPIKIEKDPYGFIGKYQAVNGLWQNISTMAQDIYQILANHPMFRESLMDSAISKLHTGQSFDTCHFVVKNILPKFNKLNLVQVKKIQEAFHENDQMHRYYYTRQELPNILYNLTGKPYRVDRKQIIERILPDILVSDIPF